MPVIVFSDGEHCSHCENNDHHNTTYKNIKPHKCEFCGRINAKGKIRMTILFYDKARSVGWNEIEMFGKKVTK